MVLLHLTAPRPARRERSRTTHVCVPSVDIIRVFSPESVERRLERWRRRCEADAEAEADEKVERHADGLAVAVAAVVVGAVVGRRGLEAPHDDDDDVAKLPHDVAEAERSTHVLRIAAAAAPPADLPAAAAVGRRLVLVFDTSVRADSNAKGWGGGTGGESRHSPAGRRIAAAGELMATCRVLVGNGVAVGVGVGVGRVNQWRDGPWGTTGSQEVGTTRMDNLGASAAKRSADQR